MSAELSRLLGGDVGITRPANRAATIRTGGLGLQAALRSIGVLNNKHIPGQYFDSGTQQRWSLLQGLMDTDGTVNRNGGRSPRPSFSNKNERLCRDVWRLARSLGLKATIRSREVACNGVPAGIAWEVSFPACKDHPVFRLERKQRLLAEYVGARSGTVSIVSCEEVESVPTVCIKVAAADSLFLAGHGCIPTHNTALSAFLLLLHLCGPEARANSQLYSAAQSREQAAILFALAAKCVRMSPDLNAVVTVRDTAKQLFCPEIGSIYRALSAEASTAYGLSPVFVVHDELGQVRGPRSELYEALETASGAQENPLSIIISTQAPTDADLLSVLIDDAKAGGDPRTRLFLYTAPEDLDPFSEEAIKAANPAYGDFQNPDEVQDQARSAQRMPSAENGYRNLILNQRVNMVNPFVSRQVWEDNAGEPLDEAFEYGDVYCGLDLSVRNDLTAIVEAAHFEQEWHIRCHFFAPFNGIGERSRRDRAPYDLWVEQGWLTATPGSTVDYDTVAEKLCEIAERGNLKAVAFDRYRMKELEACLSRMGRELPLEPFGQGFVSMAPALDALEAELLNKRVRHGNHPVLRMCAVNAVATKDPAGNRKLDKSKATGRIDGMVALVMAIGTAAKTIFEPAFDMDALANPIRLNLR
jgi:phage terminase large subunit-like protein